MEKTLQVIVSQWQDESLQNQVEDTFAKIVEYRSQDVLDFILEELFSQPNVLPYIRLLPHVPKLLQPDTFTFVCLFKICEITQLQYKASSQCILQYSQKPQIEQALEEAIIAVSPTIALTFFSNVIPAELRQREEILKFCSGIRFFTEPIQISHPLVVRFAALYARDHNPQTMLKQVLMQFNLYGEFGFLENCIIILYLIADVKDPCLLLDPLETELAGAMQYFYMLLSNSNSICTRFALLVWYFKVYRFVSPLSYIGYQEFAVKQFVKLYDELLGEYRTEEPIFQDTEFIWKSPLLCRMLGIDLSSGKEEYPRRIHELLGDIMQQILQQNAEMTESTFGRYIGSCNAQELAELQIQPGTVKSIVQTSYTALLTMENTTAGKALQRVIVERVIAAGAMQEVFELIESSFSSWKNKISSLVLVNLFLEQIKREGSVELKQEGIAFANKLLVNLFVKDLKFMLDEPSIAGFKQKDLSYYEKEAPFKIQLEGPLAAILSEILVMYSENVDLMNDKLAATYFCHIVDIYCNTFCVGGPENQISDDFILTLVENSVLLERQLITVIISTIFIREFQFSPAISPEEIEKYYNLEMREYYGSFSLLNLLAHGEHDNKVYIVEKFSELSLTFVDIFAISIMLLICMDFEAEAINIVNMREVVLSFLNYLILVSSDELQRLAFKRFFLDDEGVHCTNLVNNQLESLRTAQLLIKESQYFVSRILNTFSFKVFKIQANLSFNALFPGAKWRTYSLNYMHEIASSSFIEYVEPEEAHSDTSQFMSHYEEPDTEQVDTMICEHEVSNELSQVDDYIYAIFEFVGEIMAIVSHDAAYAFYKRCYETKLIQSTTNFKEREIEFRLSLLGFFPTLHQLNIGTSLLSESQIEPISDPSVTELTDVLLNSYDLVIKQELRITDLLFLVEGTSAANLKALLLSFKISEAKFQVKVQLQILQAALLRPCVSDIIERLTRESPPSYSDTSSVFVPHAWKIDNSMINVLTEQVDELQESKAYKQVCQLCFSVIQEIDVIGDNSVLHGNELLASVYVLVQYILDNSAFGPVLRNQELAHDCDIVFSMNSTTRRTVGQLYDSNGLTALLSHFERKDYVETFAPYRVSDYIYQLIRNAEVWTYSSDSCVANGIIAHCMKLWCESVDNLVVVGLNLRLPRKMSIFIMEKVFTIMEILQHNESIQMIYDSEIGQRLIQLLSLLTMSHFTGGIVCEIVSYLVTAALQPSCSAYSRRQIINLAIEYIVLCRNYYCEVYVDASREGINPLGLRHMFFEEAFGNIPQVGSLLEQMLTTDNEVLVSSLLQLVIESDQQKRSVLTEFDDIYIQYIRLRHRTKHQRLRLLFELMSGQFGTRQLGNRIYQKAIDLLFQNVFTYIEENTSRYFRCICSLASGIGPLDGDLRLEQVEHYVAAFKSAPHVVYPLLSVSVYGAEIYECLYMINDMEEFFKGADLFLQGAIAREVFLKPRRGALGRICSDYLALLRSAYGEQARLSARQDGNVIFSFLSLLIGDLLFERAQADAPLLKTARSVLEAVIDEPEVEELFDVLEHNTEDNIKIGNALQNLVKIAFQACSLEFGHFEHYSSFIGETSAHPVLSYLQVAICTHLVAEDGNFELFNHVIEVFEDENLPERHEFVEMVDGLLERQNCAQLIIETPEFNFEDFIMRELNRQQLARALSLGQTYAQCFFDGGEELASKLLDLLLGGGEIPSEVARALTAISASEKARKIICSNADRLFVAAEQEISRKEIMALLSRAFEADDWCEVLKCIGAGDLKYLEESIWGLENMLLLAKKGHITIDAYVTLLAEELQQEKDKALRTALLEFIRKALEPE